jgi:hypothetical protein
MKKELLFTLPPHARPEYWTQVAVSVEGRRYLDITQGGEIILVSPEDYRCDCDCHSPMGWRWKEGDPRPNLKPCAKCAEVLHMSAEEPHPVRSTPVPLTVRRHTQQSRDIFWQNLYEALPADMLKEDREKLTDELLGMAIEHGNALRRRRLIDKLMHAAEEAASWDPSLNAPYSDWSDIMADAAEEIRSLL